MTDDVDTRVKPCDILHGIVSRVTETHNIHGEMHVIRMLSIELDNSKVVIDIRAARGGELAMIVDEE